MPITAICRLLPGYKLDESGMNEFTLNQTKFMILNQNGGNPAQTRFESCRIVLLSSEES